MSRKIDEAEMPHKTLRIYHGVDKIQFYNTDNSARVRL